MRLNHKLKINLLEFIKTGKFDYVTIGKTKEWITANFPDPDFKTEPKNKLSCWGYGSIEFWFLDNKLNLIHTDHLEYLNAGKEIELDKSFLLDQTKNSIGFIIPKLNEHEIDYDVRHELNIEQIILKITNSKVQLGFGFHDQEISKDNYELLYISLKTVKQP